MLIVLLRETSDYTSQYIGLAGTLIGTFLGWLLSYITNNRGYLDISIDDKMFCKSDKNQIAYLIKLFVYNKSQKPKHMRNIKIQFYKKRRLLLEETPRNKDSNYNFIGISSKQYIDIVFMNQFETKSIVLCNILENENYQKVLQSNRILLSYRNEKNKTKKIKIHKNFSAESVQIYGQGKRFD